MATARALTLRKKLLISFAGAGLLVLALLLLGNQIIRDAATRLEATLTAQVRPLAQLNRLQSQVSRIRVLEVELPRLTDPFAVADQLEILGAETTAFGHELGAFVASLDASRRGGLVGLEDAWRRYQADLKRATTYASAMDLDGVQRISTYESVERFKTISRTLKQLAEGTERRADEAFAQAGTEHARQRILFALTSAVGLVILALWIGLLARSLTGRVSYLRDAAWQLADGSAEAPIEVGGRDELADLGAAFNTMQARVVAREGALRAAHDELESRVAERTHELHTANGQLLREIDERRRVEERLQHQAQYDSLTGLPNRLLALDRLTQAMLAAQRGGTKVVLIFLDLDDFKKINDSFGHLAGDELLVQAAQRLRHAVRSADTVARLGGDEFVVILGDLGLPLGAEPMAQKVLSAFAPPFNIGGSAVVVTPSMGLAVYPDDGSDANTLLRNADLALYEAKEAGRNTFRYFRQQVHDTSVRRLDVEVRLRDALARDEFHLVYQPFVATASRAVIGAEALLRWHSPDLGLMPPDQFIAVAERTGLIVEIGDWVLHSACRQLQLWREAGWTDRHIAVNVSPRQFHGDRLLATVRECLATYRLPASSLQVEVTEGLLIRNQPEVRATLMALNALGVRLAMDDFGSGYSSLSYLKRFPFDVLKIDREFVRDVATDPDDRALVTAAIRLGQGLGLTVVAEGVETEAQMAFLCGQACDAVQGFLFSQPLCAEQFELRWIQPEVDIGSADCVRRLAR